MSLDKEPINVVNVYILKPIAQIKLTILGRRGSSWSSFFSSWGWSTGWDLEHRATTPNWLWDYEAEGLLDGWWAKNLTLEVSKKFVTLVVINT